ncbi:MAG: PaaI family thioesterase [Candidatus Helarchaeota archaeon]|nr:PaaI family thioesterase [Candidatus Helarchaeota archaeon]
MRKEIPSGSGESYCFVCGQNNPIGLKLKFFKEDNSCIVTEFTPKKEHCGWEQLVHGGIICSVMDEAMSWTVLHIANLAGVTKELNVKFKRPIFINEGITIRSQVKNENKKEVRLFSEVINKEGVICAVGEGVYAILNKDRMKKISR